ncbi:hypothetical protein PI124_g22892 [Phytophthora idaei]|nr:hypothetical protein PI126_g22856 [Phytophthora idaei]KAG3232017.1 hypothetical protein PI124_g22892 [Phytophthora idaei]
MVELKVASQISITKQIGTRPQCDPIVSLRKIDRVKINHTRVRGGAVFYKVEVYLKRLKANHYQPNYVVLRRFSDFDLLCRHAAQHARREVVGACRYCDRFRLFMLHCYTQPKTIVKLCAGVDTRKKILERFLNRMIDLTITDERAVLGIPRSPVSRDVVPENIIETSGNVMLSESNPLAATLFGNGSTATFGFGRQISGVVTVDFGASTTSGSQLGVAFSENKRYIGITSDRATGPLVDGTLYAPAEPESTSAFGREFGRGISTIFTAAPSTEDDKLREYSGYFYSDDDLLNRIWYAGASPPAITAGWANNATIENVSVDAEVFVDGAKRDRTPWPGDYGVATLSKVVSLNGDNLLSVRNALESIIAIQASNGEFPYADFVTGVWDRIQRGFEFTLAKVDTSDSLLNVTDLNDWGRVGQGGKNTAANSLLYNALVSYVKLADELGYGELSYAGKLFSEIAKDLKRAVNVKLWDASVGFFRDNTTALGAEFYPQDGDVLVVHFNVTESLERSATISQSLATRWNEFGAVSPEALGSISPFMTSLEIDAHLRDVGYGDYASPMELYAQQLQQLHHDRSVLLHWRVKVSVLRGR